MHKSERVIAQLCNLFLWGSREFRNQWPGRSSIDTGPNPNFSEYLSTFSGKSFRRARLENADETGFAQHFIQPCKHHPF